MSDEDSLAEEMILEFFNAVEAGIAAAKQRYKERKGISQESEVKVYETLNWEPTKNPNIMMVKHDNVNNVQLFNHLLAMVDKNGGRLKLGGTGFWLAKNPDGTLNKSIIFKRSKAKT